MNRKSPALALVALWMTIAATNAWSGPQIDGPVLALHVTGKFKNLGCAATQNNPVQGTTEVLPCDYVVQWNSGLGAAPNRPYVWLMVANAPQAAGIGGISLGISYGVLRAANPYSAVVLNWTRCSDLDFPMGDWPLSGGGNRITWTAQTNCQRRQPDGTHCTAVAGFFYVTSYYDYLIEGAYLRATENFNVVPPELKFAACSAGESDIPVGNLGSIGINPSASEILEPGFNPFASSCVPCPNGQSLPYCRVIENAGLLFGERYSRDAGFMGAPGTPYFYDYTDVVVTKASGDRFFLSGAGDALSPFIGNEEVYVEHSDQTQAVNLPSNQLIGSPSLCTPMQDIFATSPFHEITQYIPMGSNCIRIKLGNIQRGIYGNTNIYLVRIAPNPPPRPSGLIATVVNSSTVSLAWTLNPNTANIQIWRATGAAGAGVLLDVIAGSNTNYADDGVLALETYYYRLIALNAMGESSPPSDFAVVRVVQPPAPPIDLAVVSSNASGVLLSWKDQACNENGFVLERREYPAGGWAEMDRPPASYGCAAVVGYLDDDVRPETEYRYRVASYWNELLSPYTSEVPTVTPAFPPNPAATVQVLRASSAANGAKVYRSRSGGEFQLVGQTDGNGLLAGVELQHGDLLRAEVVLKEQPGGRTTARAEFNNVVFSAILDSDEWNQTDGTWAAHRVSDAGPVEILNLSHPVLALNLVVAVESNLDQSGFDGLRAAFERVSSNFLQATDGQVRVGKVAVYDSQPRHYGPWWDPTNRPDAPRGGGVQPDVWIQAESVAEWKSASGPGGLYYPYSVGKYVVSDMGKYGGTSDPRWSRAVAHELFHYCLFLFDEYRSASGDIELFSQVRSLSAANYPISYGAMDDVTAGPCELSSRNYYLADHYPEAATEEAKTSTALTAQLVHSQSLYGIPQFTGGAYFHPFGGGSAAPLSCWETVENVLRYVFSEDEANLRLPPAGYEGLVPGQGAGHGRPPIGKEWRLGDPGPVHLRSGIEWFEHDSHSPGVLPPWSARTRREPGLTRAPGGDRERRMVGDSHPPGAAMDMRCETGVLGPELALELWTDEPLGDAPTLSVDFGSDQTDRTMNGDGSGSHFMYTYQVNLSDSLYSGFGAFNISCYDTATNLSELSCLVSLDQTAYPFPTTISHKGFAMSLSANDAGPSEWALAYAVSGPVYHAESDPDSSLGWQHGVAFSGGPALMDPADACLSYGGFAPPAVDPSRLRLKHWDPTGRRWALLPDQLSSAGGKKLCGSSDSSGTFSLFLVPGPSDTTPPGGVTNLSAGKGQGNGEIFIFWTEPGDDGATGRASYYDVRISETLPAGNAWDALNAPANVPVPGPGGTEGTATLLVPTAGRGYYVGIRAGDDAGNLGSASAWAYALSGASDANARPSAPENVRAIDAPGDTGGVVSVSWDRSRDDGNGKGTVSHYRILRNQPPGSIPVFLGSVPAGTTEYRDSTAAPGRLYIYWVEAADSIQSAQGTRNQAFSAKNVGVPKSDFTSDGKVGVNDFAWLIDSYGISSVNTEFEPLFDLDGNGVVNRNDVDSLQASFGTGGAPAPSSPGENPGAHLLYTLQRASGDTIICTVHVSGATDLSGYAFAVAYPPGNVVFLSAAADSLGLIPNFLRRDGGQTPAFLVNSTAPGGIWIANAIRGASSLYAPGGNGFLARLLFTGSTGEGITVHDATLIGPGKRVDVLPVTERVAVDGEIRTLRPVLFQNYPNPFSLNTAIKFSLSERGAISLRVFDVQGRLVRSLFDHQVLDRGTYSLPWDGYNTNGQPVPSGIYFYRLQTRTEKLIRKMIRLR